MEITYEIETGIGQEHGEIRVYLMTISATDEAGATSTTYEAVIQTRVGPPTFRGIPISNFLNDWPQDIVNIL